jgi:predicted ATPase
MKINKLIIENFKGIKDRKEFEIRPLTIFCGPNSSGKSSCIHALAALAQTIKLSNSQVPVALDDEYAQVHLGRFLDVIHSRSLDDSIKLGVGVDKLKYYLTPNKPDRKKVPSLEIEMEYKAKGTAQEIYVESAKIEINSISYVLSREDEEFAIKRGSKKLPFNMYSTGKFGFRPKGVFEGGVQPKEETMQAFFLGENINRNLTEVLSNVLYLGPFRQGPLRRYPTRGSQPAEVGASGEAAVPMLANEYSRSDSNHPNISQISSWVEEMGLGKRIVLSPVAHTDLFDVNVSLEDGANLPLPDLGYGISQVLPVLVQCSFAPPNSTLLFEQPELHLHEGAARKLGAVLANVAKKKNINIIAETHSPHMIMELINKVKGGDLSVDDVVIYDVCRREGKSEFKKVLIEMDNGDIWIDHPWLNGMIK